MDHSELLKSLVDMDETARKELLDSLSETLEDKGTFTVTNVVGDSFGTIMVSGQSDIGSPCVDELTFTAKHPMTKEMVREAIEKKNLPYKATDSHIEGSAHLSIKASPAAAGREAYRPSKAQLGQINKLALEPLTADNCFVFELQMADMETDRAYEHFTMEAITDMAKLSPGKPVLLDHSWSAKSIVGRIFKAKNDAGKLVQWAYFPESENTKAVTEGVLTGLLNMLSVGFAIDYEQMVCDSCKNCIYDYENCSHWPGGKDEKGKTVTITLKRVKDYHESSIIPVPCQPDSHIRMSAGEIEAYSKAYNSQIFAKGGLVGEIIPINNPRDTITLGTNTIQDSVMADENKEVPTPEAPQDEAPAVVENTEAPPAEAAPPEPAPAVVSEPKAEEKAPEIKVELPAELTKAFVELSKAVEALQKGMDSLDKKVDLAMSVPTEGLKALLAKNLAEDEEAAPQKHWLHETFLSEEDGESQ